jgi:AraC family transcriptional regulator
MLGLRPFGIEETHGMLTQPGAKIRACSDGRDWTSLFASVQQEMPFQGIFEPSKDHLLVLHRNGPVQVESLCQRGVGRRLVPPGGIHLVAPGVEFGVRLSSRLETVHVYVRRAIIEEVALEMIDGDPSRIDIPSRIIESDRSLQALIEASADALDEGTPGSSMFADYLARAIAAQLIRSCADVRLRGTRLTSDSSVCPERSRRAVSPTVSDAIDYMNANIDKAISLDDVARATNRSPSHVARMFRAELGVPPHRYLIALRVEKARRLLEKTSVSIAEIAYDCGFAHQEHLTRLFRRHCDVTPAAYRRSKRN